MAKLSQPTKDKAIHFNESVKPEPDDETFLIKTNLFYAICSIPSPSKYVMQILLYLIYKGENENYFYIDTYKELRLKMNMHPDRFRTAWAWMLEEGYIEDHDTYFTVNIKKIELDFYIAHQNLLQYSFNHTISSMKSAGRRMEKAGEMTPEEREKYMKRLHKYDYFERMQQETNDIYEAYDEARNKIGDYLTDITVSEAERVLDPDTTKNLPPKKSADISPLTGAQNSSSSTQTSPDSSIVSPPKKRGRPRKKAKEVLNPTVLNSLNKKIKEKTGEDVVDVDDVFDAVFFGVPGDEKSGTSDASQKIAAAQNKTLPYRSESSPAPEKNPPSPDSSTDPSPDVDSDIDQEYELIEAEFSSHDASKFTDLSTDERAKNIFKIISANKVKSSAQRAKDEELAELYEAAYEDENSDEDEE